MIDLDELVYKLEDGDKVMCLTEYGRDHEEAELYIIGRMLKHTFRLNFEKYLHGQDALQAQSNSDWMRVGIEYGRVINRSVPESKYEEQTIYAIKQDTWLFDKLNDRNKEEWYLFEKYRGLKKEFPELEGIL